MTATNTTKLSRCTACQRPRRRWRISSDVTSTATSRYAAAMPHATAPGRHADAYGTSRSSQSKPTNESNASAPTWATTNSSARPPRNRCRSSIHAGRGPRRPGAARAAAPRPRRRSPAARPRARWPGPCTTRAPGSWPGQHGTRGPISTASLHFGRVEVLPESRTQPQAARSAAATPIRSIGSAAGPKARVAVAAERQDGRHRDAAPGAGRWGDGGGPAPRSRPSPRRAWPARPATPSAAR